MFKKLALISAASLMAFGLPASALTASQSVYKEVAMPNDSGPPVLTRIPAETVTPGDTVVYALDFTNDQAQEVTNIVLTMPVPSDIDYIEASASEDGAEVTYSADNGESFASRDEVMIAENDEMRSAKAAEITHIRWRVTDVIEPGESGELVFKGRLK